MSSTLLRLGAPAWERVQPLLGGMDASPDIWLQIDELSVLNERLAAGELDCALLPVLDLVAHQRVRVIPGICLCAQPGTPEHAALPIDTPGLSSELPYVELVWGARFGAPLPALRRVLTLALQSGLDMYPDTSPAAYRLASAEMDSLRTCLRLAASLDLCSPGSELLFC